MGDLNPYKNWTRKQLYDHCIIQCEEYGFDKNECKGIIYDKRWDPMKDFNGCSVVQDPIHPFYPCLKHDWSWVVLGGGIEHDRQFRKDLIRSGMYGFKARRWFWGVRIGWIFFHKWKK